MYLTNLSQFMKQLTIQFQTPLGENLQMLGEFFDLYLLEQYLNKPHYLDVSRDNLDLLTWFRSRAIPLFQK